MQVNHINLKCSDVDAMRDFFVDITGLEVGKRPPFTFSGYWLYSDGAPIVHLISAAERGDNSGPGPVDHIAFDAENFDATVARLNEKGTSHEIKHVPDTGLRQIFVTGPDNVKIELLFTPD